MNWISENWEIILVILGVAGTFLKVAVVKIDKAKKELTEFKDSIAVLSAKVKKARGEDSPNGKSISTSEAKELVVALADSIAELVDVVDVSVEIVKERKK
jgi:hypothetical protein